MPVNPEFITESRAPNLLKLGPACDAVYRGILGEVSLNDESLAYVHQHVPDEQRQGIAHLYYAGLIAWKAMKEMLPDFSIEEQFTTEERAIIKAYTFLGDPIRMINAVIQSSMSSPTTLMCWWADAAGLSNPAASHGKRYNCVGSSSVQGALVGSEFSDMLRQASVTSTGYYRNSTGYEMGFTQYLGRSVRAPLRAFQIAYPDASSPIALDVAGRPSLTPEFIYFLRSRMRLHNRLTRTNPQSALTPHEGTSPGCPVADIEKNEAGQSYGVNVYQLTAQLLAKIMAA